MDAPWTPGLVARERGGLCRLWLGGEAWGDGATLQQAADDLITRVRAQARALRQGGFGPARELGPVDGRWLDFLYQVGEIEARGGDVRARVLGVTRSG
jgi:hypothetical protein